MRMPNVDLIRATHDVIVGWGRASALANGGPCDVLVPVHPGSIDIDDLLASVRTLEFVERAERFDWLRDQPGVTQVIESGDAVKLLLPGIKVQCRADIDLAAMGR